MSKLDEILNDKSATLFCMGQDWQKGDGSASKVDDIADETKRQIKDLMQELIGGDLLIDTGVSRGHIRGVNRCKAELRQKVEEL